MCLGAMWWEEAARSKDQEIEALRAESAKRQRLYEETLRSQQEWEEAARKKDEEFLRKFGLFNCPKVVQILSQ